MWTSFPPRDYQPNPVTFFFLPSIIFTACSISARLSMPPLAHGSPTICYLPLFIPLSRFLASIHPFLQLATLLCRILCMERGV
ncbi:hypothetical protein LINPERHAP2_LOCUS24440 [Linum perenne]